MENLLKALGSIYPLSHALEDRLRTIMKERKLAKRDVLLKAGHICRNIYFIEHGLLRCFYFKLEAEVSSWFMKEGDVIISVESFYTQQVSYESIQALEDSMLYYISYTELQEIFHTFPEFNFIGRVVTEKYYTLSEQRLYSLRMQRSHERYNYLMQNHPELILRVPAKYLASYLGITDVQLSNIKNRR